MYKKESIDVNQLIAISQINLQRSPSEFSFHRSEFKGREWRIVHHLVAILVVAADCVACLQATGVSTPLRLHLTVQA